ncbi:MAG TPA: site-specific DNA-methyltransferase, partial [Novosphingobium sp.]|nr:site-specific DNA-methyltransferase [Novosphingobium sp.]
ELALPLDESSLVTMQSKRSAPKVAFGALVESGYLTPGTRLTAKKGRFAAVVRADGSLQSNAEIGSIHSLGAKLQGAPSCNGWTFWHVEHDGEVKPIDALRQLYLLAVED